MCICFRFFFFFKQKTAYEMRISDWSSDVCSSDLNFAEPTWRVSLEHDLATDVLGYVSYNRGFKSGVFNAGTATAPVVEPEIVDAYEGGVKATFLDRKVRLNTAAFYYDFQDIQLSAFVSGQPQTLRNAARDRKSTRLNSSHYCEPRMPS